VGKTWKDVKAFDIKRQKEGSRMQTADMDLRTRTKPLTKKEKGGGKNRTKEIIGSYVDELDEEVAEFDFDWDDNY